jgi:hypothetical protein
MSALILTHSERRARHEHDRYLTPRSFAEKALDLVEGTPSRILDPGAGEGVWGQAAAARWPQAWIIGIDIQPGFPAVVREGPRVYDEWHVGDFLTEAREEGMDVDLVIGNPPFSLAAEFIRHSLNQLTFGGVCVFLLRLAFLESEQRANGLFREFPPEEVSVCTRRPRFYGIKGNGGTAFAFFKWRLGHKGQTRLTWSHIPRITNGKS